MNQGSLEVIDLVQAGEAVASLVGDPAQVVFQVRERSAEIKYLGETSVQSRGKAFLAGTVVVVVVLFRIGRYVQKEYATWWNYALPEDRGKFEAMRTQDYLSYCFYGDSYRRERTFIEANALQGFFADLDPRLESLPPWSAAEFEAARLEVLGREASLWDSAASLAP